MSSAVDLIIAHGDVVTMNTAREVLAGGAVAISGDRIAAVGSSRQLLAAHPDAAVIDATNCVVTPGMINAHQHVGGGPLARACIPDNLVPGTSIFFWSIPLHAAETADDEELAALINSVENLRNGVTTVVEAGTMSYPDRVAGAMRQVGIRGTVGIWGWDVGQGPLVGPADEVLDLQRDTLDRIGSDALVSAWVTLVGHSLASDELLAGAADLARSRGTGMTMHMSPTKSDPEVYLERHGRRPLVHLDELGVLGEHLLLAHAVWLDDAEAEALMRTDTAIAYCPWAYLRLGQGVAANGRHADLFQAGARVALGCDSNNAGDHTDILKAAALAAGLAKDTKIDPTWFGAHEAFEMATIRGAAALGLADRIGSLEPGKLADVVVHDATGPEWRPRGDVALQLVWSADGRSVRDVVVGGQPVVRDARCVNVDEDELRRLADQGSADLMARAGIEVPHRWPIVPSY